MYNATSKEVWKTWLAARCPHPKTSQGQHAVQMPLEHFHGILGGRSPRHHGHVYIYHNGPKVWPNNPSHLYATCIGARASQFGIRQKLRVSTRHLALAAQMPTAFDHWTPQIGIEGCESCDKNLVYGKVCFFSGRQSSWLSNSLLPHVFHMSHTSSTVSSSKTFFKGLHGKFHETLGVRCRAGGNCMQLLDISTSATAESSSVMACGKLVGLVSP